MYIKEQLYEPTLKPCPYCGQATILVSTVSYENGDDDGYKVMCSCGWAGRKMRGWYSNKVRLIGDWNDLIHDAEI